MLEQALQVSLMPADMTAVAQDDCLMTTAGGCGTGQGWEALQSSRSSCSSCCPRSLKGLATPQLAFGLLQKRVSRKQSLLSLLQASNFQKSWGPVIRNSPPHDLLTTNALPYLGCRCSPKKQQRPGETLQESKIYYANEPGSAGLLPLLILSCRLTSHFLKPTRGARSRPSPTIFHFLLPSLPGESIPAKNNKES